jgi:hypothetical protein
MSAYAGRMACPEKMVRANLKAALFPPKRYVVHKGFFDQVLREGANLPKEISFAYLDFDFYEPIKIALDFIDHKTTVGSIIIVDDYDFFSTGVKVAVDEFLEIKNSDTLIYDCLVPNSCYGHFAVLTRKG